MSEPRITRAAEVERLLGLGWKVDGYDLVSPTGERRGAWINAIEACRKRGLLDEQDVDRDFAE